MVDKNMEIVVKEVEGDVSEDKYYNVLKGRRTAAEQCVWGMKKVDSLYKEIDGLAENEVSGYYKEKLPELIDSLKSMFSLNLQVIDIDLDPFEDDTNLIKQVEDDLVEMFGKKTVAALLRNSVKSITEDKLHNVIRSRTTAAEDCEWVMTTIDSLESLEDNEEEDGNTNFAKRFARSKK